MAYVLVSVILAAVIAVFATALAHKGILVAARMTVQAVTFLLFIFLLLQAVAPIDGYLALAGVIPADLFMRMSPVVAVSAMLAGRVLIAGMLLAIATLATAVLAGRWFCGWICPLGTTLDATDRALFAKADRPAARDSRMRGAKYVLVVVIVFAAAFGADIAGWFDPMSIVTRSYTVVVVPVADRAAKAVFDTPRVAKALAGAESDLKSMNVLFDRDHYYMQFGVFALILAGLIGAQAYQKRFWCRKLCPLGAMLGLAGKWRPFGVRLDEGKCIDCGKCRRICPVGAIQGKGLSPQECVFCGSCVRPCPVDALHVGFGGFGTAPAPRIVPGRRALLAAAAGGIVTAPLLLVNAERQSNQTTVVRPPGAQDEDELLDRCVRCGECMKACPQNALHPTGFEAGISGLWTPKIVPTIGYCDYNCLSEDAKVGNFCSTVCPTGAIKKLTPQEHRTVHRGTAYFRVDRCIPYVERKTCSVCVEHCPVPEKALKDETVDVIDFETGQPTKILRPHVDQGLCIGCGQCENVCPLKGTKGIRVEPVRSKA